MHVRTSLPTYRFFLPFSLVCHTVYMSLAKRYLDHRTLCVIECFLTLFFYDYKRYSSLLTSSIGELKISAHIFTDSNVVGLVPTYPLLALIHSPLLVCGDLLSSRRLNLLTWFTRPVLCTLSVASWENPHTGSS